MLDLVLIRSRLFLGSVTDEVIRGSQLPVLVHRPTAVHDGVTVIAASSPTAPANVAR